MIIFESKIREESFEFSTVFNTTEDDIERLMIAFISITMFDEVVERFSY